MVSPAEALDLILEKIPLFHREDCPLAAAHGRILRSDVRADRDFPPFNRATMDGFAVNRSALAAGVREFSVVGLQGAGMLPLDITGNTTGCVELMTGAALPSGADCVIPYEEATKKDRVVVVSEAARGFAQWNAVHRRGSDHQKGEVTVRAGTRLTGREIAVAAACGQSILPVSWNPKIAVLATGDELVEVDAAIVGAHQLRRSNDYALKAALASAGFTKVERFHVRDMRHEIEHMLWHLLAEYDVLLVTGGISKGKFDYLPEELDRQRVSRIFQGVAQRPGKPFWFGMSSRMTPVFALPGNPVSAYTCLHRYVLPALVHASGGRVPRPGLVALAAPFDFKPDLACLLPVSLSSGPHAERLATPQAGNTSGDLTGLIDTDGFVELPRGADHFPKGYIAPFWPWV